MEIPQKYIARIYIYNIYTHMCVYLYKHPSSITNTCSVLKLKIKRVPQIITLEVEHT